MWIHTEYAFSYLFFLVICPNWLESKERRRFFCCLVKYAPPPPPSSPLEWMPLDLWATFNLHQVYLLRYFWEVGEVKGFIFKSLMGYLKVKIPAWSCGAQKIFYFLLTWISYDGKDAGVNYRKSSMVTLTLGRTVFFSSSEMFSETLDKWEVPKETDSVDLSFSNEGQKDLEYLCLPHPAAYIKPVLFLGKLVNLGSDYRLWQLHGTVSDGKLSNSSIKWCILICCLGANVKTC